MATGDITATIRPDGWTVSLSVEGFTINATYNFGLTGNNIITASTPYLDVVSLGFDDTGAASTINRKVYLTSVIRLPYSCAYISGTYGSGTFTDGETVTQATSGATGIIVGNQSSGTRLYFKTITGTFDNSHLCTGGTSGATFTSSSTITTPTVPTKDEKPQTALTVVCALSDYVFQKDNSGGGNSGTAPTITIPSGFIVNSGGGAQNSNALTAAAVTQSSTAAYPKVVGNWSWPGYERITGSTFTTRCVVFHGSAQQGRPVRCVVFTAADTHSNTDTQTVTRATIDTTNMTGDQVPVIEFVATHSSTNLTALDVITCNFKAYPWVGDSGSILDTSAGTAQPTPLYGPIKLLCDKSATYHATCAVVAATGGNDGTGAVAANDDFATAAATPYLTLGKALSAIAAFNNSNYSRNNIGGGKVYMKTGAAYTVLGSSNSYGATSAADAWAEVLCYPGVARSDVTFTGQSGNFIPSYFRIKFNGVTFSGTGANTFGGGTSVWVHNCVLNLSANGWWSGGTACYFIWNTVTVANAGLRQFGTTVMSPCIIRGNLFESTFSGSNTCFMMIGNKKTGVSTNSNGTFYGNTIAGAAPAFTNWVCAYNIHYGFSATSGTLCSLSNGATETESHGGALVQNIFEKTSVENATGGIGIGSDSTTGTPINNMIIWHNTVMGVKMNGPYNSKGTASALRYYWSMCNNLFYDENQKDDTFTGDGGASGNRIGNWPSGVWRVGNSGNMFGDDGNGFAPEFYGLNSKWNNWSAGAPSAYFLVVDYKAYDNHGGAGSPGAGTGDYHLTSTSPAAGLVYQWVLPYDISGTVRNSNDSSGAFTYSTFNPGLQTGFNFFR